MPAKIKANGLGSFRALSTSGLKVESLSSSIKDYIQEQAKVCQPDKVYVCDGSEEENKALIEKLLKDGRLKNLPKYENW